MNIGEIEFTPVDPERARATLAGMSRSGARFG
jgi:hypothetical protein